MLRIFLLIKSIILYYSIFLHYSIFLLRYFKVLGNYSEHQQTIDRREKLQKFVGIKAHVFSTSYSHTLVMLNRKLLLKHPLFTDFVPDFIAELISIFDIRQT